MSRLGKYRSLKLGSSEKSSEIRANALWRVIAFLIDAVIIRLSIEFAAFVLHRLGLISQGWMEYLGSYLAEGLAPLRGGALSLQEILIITSFQDLTIHLIYSTVFLTYFIVLESGNGWGKTIGKMIFKMEVRDRRGDRISLKKSFLRNITKYLLRLPLIGVVFGLIESVLLIMYSTRTGDLLADTKVVSTAKKGPFDWFTGSN